MSRINLKKIAEDYDFIIKAEDYGRYGQWKKADIKLYIDNDFDRGYILEGIDHDMENQWYNNLRVAAGIGQLNGKRKFMGYNRVYNDDFNERYLREQLDALVKLFRMHKDEGLNQ